MWYLQTDTLLAVVGFSLGLALLRKVLPLVVVQWLIPLASLGVIAWISPTLAQFSLGYALAGWVLCGILRVLPWGKKLCFPLFCLLALAPFVLSRGESFGWSLPFVVETVGLAFQMLKVIDGLYYVYYGGERVELGAFLGYMLYLPVFTSGPLFRYRDFRKSWSHPLPLTAEELALDVQKVIRGLFQKVVLAQAAALAMAQLTGRTLCLPVCLGITAVSWCTLWLDLSGYSDIAIGLGRLGGLAVPENFKNPLGAPTFTQFWRSWHATLSDWIREHVYVVVAKKKLGRGASAAIALATMVLMSLWHGFNLPYLLAGIYNGALLAGENLLGLTTVNRRKAKKPVLLLRSLLVNFLFGLNTLVFTLPPETVLAVLRGFGRLS